MNLETIKSVLWRFTSDDPMRDRLLGIHNDTEFIVSTNGHLLIEVSLKEYPKLSSLGEKIADFPNYKSVIPDVSTSEKHEEIPVEFSHLFTPGDKFTFKANEVKKCPQCKGKGEETHYCNCEHCDIIDYECEYCEGTGEVSAEDDEPLNIIDIDGTWFQAAYINLVVEAMQAFDLQRGIFHRGINKKNQQPASLFIGPGIQILCMAVMQPEIDNDSRTKVINQISLKQTAQPAT